jgi:hypothetical protein
MTAPYLSETIVDGALGSVSDNPSNVVAMIGAATSGTANAIYEATQPQTIAETLVSGPLASAAALVLGQGEGKVTVLAVPATKTAGSLGTVTKTAAASGDGDIDDHATPSVPVDDFDLVIKITLAGAGAAARLKYSLDGGFTYSDEVLTAASMSLGATGISLALTGTFDLGDIFAAEVKGPTVTAANVTTALQALLDDPRRWKLVHVVGIPTDATVGWAIAQAVDTKLLAAASSHRFARALCDGPEVADSALAAASYTQTLKRTGAPADFVLLSEALAPRSVKRPLAWPVVARVAKSPIHHDVGRVLSGPLQGVGRLKSKTSDVVAWAYHDEQFASTKLDEIGFMAATTIIGRQGVFVVQGTMLTAPSSDFRLLQNGLVMDRACTVVYDAMLDYLNRELETDPLTGYLDPVEANSIENDVGAELVAALINEKHATAVEFKVRRDINLHTTKKLLYRVRVIPYGYAKYIEGEFGFTVTIAPTT